MEKQERYHGLDFVRAMAMILGVVIHTVSHFQADLNPGGGGGEYNGHEYNSFIGNAIHLFRMQLFFLLAGFFAEMIRNKRGINLLIYDRIKRIVIPVLLGLLFMVPFIWAITGWSGGSIYNNTYEGLGWFDRYKTAFLWGVFTDRSLLPLYDLWHFWFVYFLMYFYITHWIFSFLGERDFLFKDNKLFIFLAKQSISKKYGLLLMGLLCFPLHYSLQSPTFFPSFFNFQINEMAYYFIYYIFGVYLFKNTALLNHLSNNCWYYFFASFPFIFVIHEPTTRHDLSNSVVVDITSWKIASIHLWEEGVFANGLSKIVICAVRCTLSWSLCFAFIGLAQRYLSEENKYIRYLADSAYWVYWVHPLFTLPLAKVAHQIPISNSLIKSFFVLYLTMFTMYLMYNIFIRYSFLGNFFMNRKKTKSDSCEDMFTIYHLAKKTFPASLLTFSIICILGYTSNASLSDNKNFILVEALVARDRNVLLDCISVSGINDRFGRTALHGASYANEKIRRYNPVPILLKKEAEIDAIDFVGRTPIFYSVRKGNIDDVRILIQAGANLNLADKYGHTPIHVAAIKSGLKNKKSSKKYISIFQLLKENGADLTLKDYKGRTPIDCLNYFGNREPN